MMLLKCKYVLKSFFRLKMSHFHPNPGTKLAPNKKHLQFAVSFITYNQTRCLLEKALPEPNLRYLSNANALYLSVNAI